MFHKLAPPFIIAILLLGCAQVRQPSGGPKDTFAPQIDTTIPPNFSVDFNADKISIEFNEYIKLNNISEQLIVSPRLSEDPEVFVKRTHPECEIARRPFAEHHIYIEFWKFRRRCYRG